MRLPFAEYTIRIEADSELPESRLREAADQLEDVSLMYQLTKMVERFLESREIFEGFSFEISDGFKTTKVTITNKEGAL